MSAATEFDVGPLTWVKGEIDQALERAGAALDEFEKSGEVTQFKFCRTHVHQVHGALDIVGLSGVTELTEALENLLQTLESDPGANAAAALPDVREALHGLRNYLDGRSRANHTSPCAFCRYVPAWLNCAAHRRYTRVTSSIPISACALRARLSPPPNSAPTKSVPYYVPSA